MSLETELISSGGGGDGPLPNRVRIVCTIDSPSEGQTFNGAEPGFILTIQGSATARLESSSGGLIQNLATEMSLSMAGRTYHPLVAANGTWSLQCHVYNAGGMEIDAVASAIDPSERDTVSFTLTRKAAITFGSQTPTITITAPPAGTTENLGENGADVQVIVEMADSALFGDHTIQAQPDNGTGSSLSPVSGSTTVFSGTVHLAPMPLGGRSITVIGACAAAPQITTAPQKVELAGKDVGSPHVHVDHPAKNGPAAAILNAAQTQYTVAITGGASDSQSGMAGGQAGVAVATSRTGPFTPARATVGSDFAAWTVDALAVPGAVPAGSPPGSLGTFPLYVWATDAAGNRTGPPLEWAFEAIVAWVPTTIDERLSPRAYLSDLVSFAIDQIKAVPPVSPDSLSTVLAQPFNKISKPATPESSAAEISINELRIPIEVLRDHMKNSTPPMAASAQGESDYLTVAYRALLAGCGTSQDELRAARGAPPEARRRLADRLAIPLYDLAGAGAPRPDQLDALALDGATLNEQVLYDLFELPQTTLPFDPRNTKASAQLLRQWRLEYQRNSWLSQDTESSAQVTYSVIVDPDIITEADVRNDATLHDQVLNLLNTRARSLKDQSDALILARTKAAANPDGGWSAMLSAGIPGTDIIALSDEETKGVVIGPQLAAAGLDQEGFTYLVALQTIATSDTARVTDAEWSDALDVLVGAFRRRQYPTWSTEESGIVLSPDIFRPSAPTVNIGRLRINPQCAIDWTQTLSTRVSQRQSLMNGIEDISAAAEQASLPVLRNALLSDIAISEVSAPEVIGSQVSNVYQVDVQVNGALRTTRLEQATTSLQALLLQIRAGDYAPSPTAARWTLNVSADLFDQSWNSIGTINSWRAATMAFLFPEAALDPALLASAPRNSTFLMPSDPYMRLCNDIVGQRGADLTGPVQTYVGTAPSGANAGTGVSGLLQSALGPKFAGLVYLKDRSLANQNALSTMSAYLSGPGAAGITPDPRLAREVFWAVPMLIGQRLHADGQYQNALDWLWVALPYNTGLPVSAYDVINEELTNKASAPVLTRTNWMEFNPFLVIQGRPYPYTRATLLAIITCLLDYGDAEFAAESDESIAHARNLYSTATALLAQDRLAPVPPATIGDGTLQIPQLDVLGSRVQNQTMKLRQDRNIAGLPRRQSTISGDPIRQPTPYHYKVLLARAQQFAQQATSMEGQYFAALEKYDNKVLQLSDATNAASISQAQLGIHSAQVQQANDAVKAAVAQHDKASASVNTLTSALNAPPNQYEKGLLEDYADMKAAQDVLTVADTAMSIANEASLAASGAVTSFGASIASAAISTAFTAAKGIGQLRVNSIQQKMQVNQLQASIEDRKQAWQMQLAGAQQDVAVAQAQVTTANDQVNIATQEQQVASLQSEHAQAALRLLSSQFTNPDLYNWLSSTLGGIYRYFLQQSTATARLAQAQLAFERVEPAKTFIGADYWQPLTTLPASLKGDARGLTGAERLTQDLERLDQYAFSSDTRRLNISQTFSFASLAPVEFINFRSTGQISVATPTSLFDMDFPGHYQRLIRQVRLSIVALVPPGRGLRATLASYGISRVTTNNSGVFTQVLLRRDPGVIALTSAVDATGVFMTDLQPEMLLPFEGSGVDTTWDLTLPRAGNPFDFSTISDVLLTIDYTALFDPNYQARIVRELNADRTVRGDQVFSLARDFPDQWYDLNNPPLTSGRNARITLSEADFPINSGTLSLANIAVRLSGKGATSGVSIGLSHGGTSATATTDSTSIASTRGSAASWVPFETTPLGEWQLSFDPTTEHLFSSGGLDDVLLVFSWTGQSPVRQT